MTKQDRKLQAEHFCECPEGRVNYALGLLKAREEGTILIREEMEALMLGALDLHLYCLRALYPENDWLGDAGDEYERCYK